jgi:hypothetical protein
VTPLGPTTARSSGPPPLGVGHEPPELLLCPDCLLLQARGAASLTRSVAVGERAAWRREEAEGLAARLIEERQLGPDRLVIEVRSGRGGLLRRYVDREIPVLGLEIDLDAARAAEAAGVPTQVGPFDAALGARLATEGRRADVVHARDVLGIEVDPGDFVRGVTHLLEPSGLAVLEIPKLFGERGPELPATPRPAYFSLTALDALLSRHELTARHVEQAGTHGDLLRVFADRRKNPFRSEALRAELELEAAAGVLNPSTYGTGAGAPPSWLWPSPQEASRPRGEQK